MIKSNVKAPVLLEVPSISDDRGLLIPFTDYVDDKLFKRCYMVENYGKGVIRGLHYHQKETKVFTVACGAAKFVTVSIPADIAKTGNVEEVRAHFRRSEAMEWDDSERKWCNSNKEIIQTHVISSRHHAVLVVPPFFANGWVSLEEHTVLVSLSSLRFEQAKKDDIRFDPYVLGDLWRVKGR